MSMAPTSPPFWRVNQTRPSGPRQTPNGPAGAVGRKNFRICPVVTLVVVVVVVFVVPVVVVPVVPVVVVPVVPVVPVVVKPVVVVVVVPLETLPPAKELEPELPLLPHPARTNKIHRQKASRH